MRIAIGPSDPAGVGSALAAGLRERGHVAEVATWVANPWGFPADRVVGTGVRVGRYALGTVPRADVVHVMGGRSWLFYADLLATRARGHLPLIQYNGSDCRTSDIAERLHPARARIVDHTRDREIRLHRRLGGRAARAAVVQDLELADYLRGSFRRIYVAPFAIDLDAVERAEAGAAHDPGEGDRLRVVHAPSDRRIKGSDAIAAAVAQTKGVELVEVAGRHDDVLAAVGSADVVVDQLNSETPGVLAAEAMALGRPVLCEYDPAKLAPVAAGCPVVPATAETLAATLTQLAGDPDRRARLGQEGRDYARRVHAPAAAAQAAEQVYGHASSAPPGVYAARPDGVSPLS